MYGCLNPLNMNSDVSIWLRGFYYIIMVVFFVSLSFVFLVLLFRAISSAGCSSLPRRCAALRRRPGQGLA